MHYKHFPRNSQLYKSLTVLTRFKLWRLYKKKYENAYKSGLKPYMQYKIIAQGPRS